MVFTPNSVWILSRRNAGALSEVLQALKARQEKANPPCLNLFFRENLHHGKEKGSSGFHGAAPSVA